MFLLAAGTALAKSDDQGGKKPPTAEEFIQKLDKDGDGKVSQAEFDGPDEHFASSDANKDGYITEDEVPSGPPPRKDR
jgi:Ca2+-binding EF-hand superfamily protein